MGSSEVAQAAAVNLFRARIVVLHMKVITWAIPAIVVSAAFGQVAPQSAEFEVASIKPSAPMNGQVVNVGVHIDGAQFRSNFLSIKDYIRAAYRVKDFQVVGPDAMSERFDISAKIPEGVPREKLPEMLKALLVERFGLKVHNGTKEFPVYALVVKDRSKLKESPVDSESEADAAKAPMEAQGTGGRGGVNFNYGHGSFVDFSNNKFEAKKLTVAILAEWLERFMDRPVVDKTELTAKFDFKFELTEQDYHAMQIRAAVAAGVNLPPEALKLLESATDDSLHSALAANGLKLEPRKAPMDALIVDHVERTPTAN
jgi:uncharacterized protein (TIGR03435 family)